MPPLRAIQTGASGKGSSACSMAWSNAATESVPVAVKARRLDGENYGDYSARCEP